MSGWNGSSRRDRLPSNWNKLRKQVLRDSGGFCQIQSDYCTVIATEVDHIVAGDDHRLSNLRAVCTDCHKLKSSSEGGSAAAARREQINNRFRREERHPGDLT